MYTLIIVNFNWREILNVIWSYELPASFVNSKNIKYNYTEYIATISKILTHKRKNSDKLFCYDWSAYIKQKAYSFVNYIWTMQTRCAKHWMNRPTHTQGKRKNPSLCHIRRLALLGSVAQARNDSTEEAGTGDTELQASLCYIVRQCLIEEEKVPQLSVK